MERLSAPERTREELLALMNGELGTAAGRGDLVRLALRLIVEEGSRENQRRAWTGTLRARRGRQSRLSQRLSTGQDEDGGGCRVDIGSASPGHA